MLPLDKLMANANMGSGTGELQIWIKYKLLSKLIFIYYTIFCKNPHKIPIGK